MGQGPHAEIISPYFLHMKSLLQVAFVLDEIQIENLHLVTAKSLYSGFTSTFPPPKIVSKYNTDWCKVWQRLQSPMLEPMAREVLFLLINNIVSNRDRLFHKFNMANSPDCVLCSELHDNVHIFCECILVRESWFWIRQRLLQMFPSSHGNTSNFEFLNFMFDSSVLDNEVIWMLGIYVELVWNTVICKKKVLKLESVKSEFSLKYLTHQASSMPNLAHIVGLLD